MKAPLRRLNGKGRFVMEGLDVEILSISLQKDKVFCKQKMVTLSTLLGYDTTSLLFMSWYIEMTKLRDIVAK